MDYTSLKEISETIIAVIQNEVDPAENVKVFPEILKTDRNGVGFYLFHVQENSNYKNLPAPGNDIPPVKYTPMALNLFYQLSANWRENELEDAFEEQVLMSAAMKGLHDNAEIYQTKDGKKIHIRITLQTLTPSESVQYWAASESPVKLSAYYEVSVVFMGPETMKSYSGRVLSYGNYIFLAGPPQISATSNTIEYTDPALNTRQVSIQPAQAPPNNINPAPVNSVVNITGSGFTGGVLSILLIRSFGDEANKFITTNAAWNMTLQKENQLSITVRETGTNRRTGLPAPMVPGMYALQVINKKQQTLPGGTIKDFLQTSNQFPISIMPRIDNVADLGAGRFRITGYLFVSANIAPNEVKVYVGSDAFFEVTVNINDPLFTIVNASTIEIDTTHITPGVKPLRIIVNGIESEPKWITVP